MSRRCFHKRALDSDFILLFNLFFDLFQFPNWLYVPRRVYGIIPENNILFTVEQTETDRSTNAFSLNLTQASFDNFIKLILIVLYTDLLT